MHRIALGAVFFLVLTNGYRSTFCNATTVHTPVGTIMGTPKNVTFKQEVYTVDFYLGIPYAKPPVGELRFKKPEPFGVFTEPFNASAFGPSCPQAKSPIINMGADFQSEDCLYLNIFVPRQPPDMTLGHAVMLFIHGGGFSVGNGDLYNGEALASIGNVIIVTINYRIGLLGFLDTDDDKARGNFGIWDQRLALEWVNTNIGAFGGNRERVTIYGESAGSNSVGIHMLYPKNKGLFQGGITQSGPVTMPGAYRTNSIDSAKYFAEQLGCSIETMDEVFDCLKTATSVDIINVVSDTMNSMDMLAMIKINTLPTIDGDIVKESPEKLFEKVKLGEESEEIDFFRSLKLINGVNGQEGALVLLMRGQGDNENLEISREHMNTQQIPAAWALKYAGRQLPDFVKELIISSYTDWSNPDEPTLLREQMIYLYGDVWFNVPAVETTRMHCITSDADSYFYIFNAVPYKRLKGVPSWVKSATHGEELGAVFGYKADLKTFLNTSEYLVPNWELDLSERLMTYWANFAKSGNPNGATDDELSRLVWPKYDARSQAFITFDREDSVGNFAYARETDLWTNLVPRLLQVTEHTRTISSAADSCTIVHIWKQELILTCLTLLNHLLRKKLLSC